MATQDNTVSWDEWIRKAAQSVGNAALPVLRDAAQYRLGEALGLQAQYRYGQPREASNPTPANAPASTNTPAQAGGFFEKYQTPLLIGGVVLIAALVIVRRS